MLHWTKTETGYVATTAHGTYQTNRRGSRFVLVTDGTPGRVTSLTACRQEAEAVDAERAISPPAPVPDPDEDPALAEPTDIEEVEPVLPATEGDPPGGEEGRTPARGEPVPEATVRYGLPSTLSGRPVTSWLAA